MMKNNHFNYGSGRSTRHTPFVKGLAVVCLLTILSYVHIQYMATPVVLSVAEPLLQEQGVVKESLFGLLALVRTKSALVIENRALQRQLAEERGKDLLIDMLRTDMQTITSGFENINTKTVAPIISRPPVSLYDTAFISVGNVSVSVGDYVAAPGGSVMGVIDTVFSDIARVRLFSSPGESHTFMLHKKNILIVVSGAGGGMMQAVVPKDLDVAVGDVLVLPEKRTAPVGVVAALGVASAGSLKVLGITPIVNIQEIGFMAVLPIVSSIDAASTTP